MGTRDNVQRLSSSTVRWVKRVVPSRAHAHPEGNYSDGGGTIGEVREDVIVKQAGVIRKVQHVERAQRVTVPGSENCCPYGLVLVEYEDDMIELEKRAYRDCLTRRI